MQNSQRELHSGQNPGKHFSLRERLMLFIGILLCSVIITFGLVSYYGVRNASIKIAKKRLRNVTNQLGDIFGQSAEGVNAMMLETTHDSIIAQYLQSKGTVLQKEALQTLAKLPRDSAWLLVELSDTSHVPLLWYGNKKAETKPLPDTIFTSIKVNADSSSLGKIYAIGDSMYYPTVAPVRANQNIAGYLIIWQSLLSSIKGVDQLSELMGSGAALYIRNTDGTLMTDLIKKIPEPPVDLNDPNSIYAYSNSSGNKVLAAIQPIRGTAWCILVEFSEEKILDTATSYLHFIFIAGIGLIIIAMFITWLISRNIVKPLQKLTAAVAAVAEGNYSTVVDVNRSDEIGSLAGAFNVMAKQIHSSQTDLENKVVERTSQLQIANKELESFTYSVSHDLRAPLRGIIGFTSILEQEYTGKLDDEAKRLTFIIKKNTQKMADLIDDLLAFSKLGRNEIVKTHINTNEMVSDIIKGLDANSNIKWDIQSLPGINADIKAIRQVWINLISNAIKYSRKKEQPHIEIGAHNHEKETVFFIKDNGVGFDQHYAYKLFKVFQRLHTADEFEGTGVGLAIVEKIISKHGGSVWVEAEEGKGATFFFAIPAE